MSSKRTRSGGYWGLWQHLVTAQGVLSEGTFPLLGQHGCPGGCAHDMAPR